MIPMEEMKMLQELEQSRNYQAWNLWLGAIYRNYVEDLPSPMMPFLVTLGYFACVTSIAMFIRMILDTIYNNDRSGERQHPFYQMVSAFQSCALLFPEALIQRTYGYVGLTAYTLVNYYFAQNLNEGIIVSALDLIAELFSSVATKRAQAGITLAGQAAGVIVAWQFTLASSAFLGNFYPDEAEAYAEIGNDGMCIFKLQNYLIVLACIQFITGFFMKLFTRHIYKKHTDWNEWPIYYVTAAYTIYFLVARHYLGFPGFEPLFTLFRGYNCTYLHNWKILTAIYLIAPVAGWICAHHYRKPTSSELKRENKTKQAVSRAKMEEYKDEEADRIQAVKETARKEREAQRAENDRKKQEEERRAQLNQQAVQPRRNQTKRRR